MNQARGSTSLAGRYDQATTYVGPSPNAGPQSKDEKCRLLMNRLDELLDSLEPWAFGLPIPEDLIRPNIKSMVRALAALQAEAAFFGLTRQHRRGPTPSDAGIPGEGFSEAEYRLRHSLVWSLLDECSDAVKQWAFDWRVPDDRFRPDMKVWHTYLRGLATYIELLRFASARQVVPHTSIYPLAPEQRAARRAVVADLLRRHGINPEDLKTETGETAQQSSTHLDQDQPEETL